MKPLDGNFVFDDFMNAFCRYYLLTHPESSKKLTGNLLLDEEKLRNSVSSALLQYDGVSFKTYGENIALVMLIRIYGKRGLEHLIEEGCIKFQLWNVDITMLMNDQPLPLMPLQSMVTTSGPHDDPEESIETGLRWLPNDIRMTRSERRSIVRSVSKLYSKADRSLAEKATAFSYDAYKSGLYNNMGLSSEEDITKLTKDKRSRLLQLAANTFELSLMAEFNLMSRNSPDMVLIGRHEAARLKKLEVIDAFREKIMEIHKLPDFEKMFEDNLIRHADVPNIRNKSGMRKFRKSLFRFASQNLGGVDEKIIYETYIEELNRIPWVQTDGGKLLKESIVFTLSTLATAPFIGPQSIVVGASLTLLDAFFLDKFLQGWNFKTFLESDLKNLLASEQPHVE